jgi:hypothetical protein
MQSLSSRQGGGGGGQEGGAMRMLLPDGNCAHQQTSASYQQQQHYQPEEGRNIAYTANSGNLGCGGGEVIINYRALTSFRTISLWKERLSDLVIYCTRIGRTIFNILT